MFIFQIKWNETKEVKTTLVINTGGEPKTIERKSEREEFKSSIREKIGTEGKNKGWNSEKILKVQDKSIDAFDKYGMIGLRDILQEYNLTETLKWLNEQEKAKEATPKRGSGGGGRSSPMVTAFISETKHKQDVENKERTEEIVKEHKQAGKTDFYKYT
ncbi:MAG: hypothetical protein NTV88_02875 [Candidatus Micrarchaeota archaeon]|nr:hypothetical protein [Candidatus Micrarchaeota archaeon]